MPKLSTTPAITTEVKTQVKLSATARQMIRARCLEYTDLAIQVTTIKGTKKKPGRMRRITDEIETVFKSEKQGSALVNGCDVDGYSLKLVIGSSKRFDQLGFMKKHGLTQADFDEFTTTKDNEPYIKITPPGGGSDDE